MGFFHENVLHAHLPSKTYSVEPELNQRPMDIFCSNLILYYSPPLCQLSYRRLQRNENVFVYLWL